MAKDEETAKEKLEDETDWFCYGLHAGTLKQDLYMDLPQGLDPCMGNQEDYILKLKKNIFGQKQARRVWN